MGSRHTISKEKEKKTPDSERGHAPSRQLCDNLKTDFQVALKKSAFQLSHGGPGVPCADSRVLKADAGGCPTRLRTGVCGLLKRACATVEAVFGSIYSPASSVHWQIDATEWGTVATRSQTRINGAVSEVRRVPGRVVFSWNSRVLAVFPRGPDPSMKEERNLKARATLLVLSLGKLECQGQGRGSTTIMIGVSQLEAPLRLLPNHSPRA